MPKEKEKSEKTLKGSSRIKQVGDTHWGAERDILRNAICDRSGGSADGMGD